MARASPRSQKPSGSRTARGAASAAGKHRGPVSPLGRRASAKTVTKRGHSQPPPALADFIRLVNSEQLYQRELPDEGALFDAACKVHPPVSGQDYLDLLVTTRAETVARLSPEARAFLGPPEDPVRPFRFSERWELLKSAGEVLSALAQRSSVGGARKRISSNLLIFDRKFKVGVPFRMTIGIVINELGQGELQKNDLLDALLGAHLDHVRSCAVCRRIFWAPRRNSECCSQRCRKVFNQRNSRANRKGRTRRKGGSGK